MSMRIIVGIDPDVKKSGIAVVDANTGKIVELLNLNFVAYLKFVKRRQFEIVKIVLSAGWLINKSNFHRLDQKISKQMGEKLAEGVGRNHQVGILQKEVAEALGIVIQELRPQGKVEDHQAFVRMTGYTGKQTNPETRDAGMLVYGMTSKS